MEAVKKKIGRPTKPVAPGERASLGLRVKPEVKSALEAAAVANGRSQSQEAEYRLEASFERVGLLSEVLALGYGAEIAGLLMAIGNTIRDVGPLAALLREMSPAARGEWFNDPYAFEQVVQAVTRLLDVLRPEGDRTSA